MGGRQDKTDDGKSAPTYQFWVTMCVTVVGFATTIYVSHRELTAVRHESEQSHASTELNALNGAVTRVRRSLTAEAGVYVSKQTCVAEAKPGVDCCARTYDFDTEAADAAWDDFEIALTDLDPYLYRKDELALLSQLRGMPKAHQQKMTPLLCPSTVAEADAGYRQVIATRDGISAAFEALRRNVTDNRRSP